MHHQPAPTPSWPSLHTLACFAVVCVAASSIATQCKRLHLPLITGYILGGIVCGPFVLALLSEEATVRLGSLINDDAMGFIGFSAGSKFLLSELRGSLGPVLCLLAVLVGTTYTLVGCGIWLASPYLSMTADATDAERGAIALIVACLAVARSPSSAIAIVSELDAHGTFTTAVLSVTVLMDVVVVVLFAVTLLLVHALAPPDGDGDGDDAASSASVGQVLGLFGLQMGVSVVVGLLLGFLIHGLMSCTRCAAKAEHAAAAVASPNKASASATTATTATNTTAAATTATATATATTTAAHTTSAAPTAPAATASAAPADRPGLRRRYGSVLDATQAARTAVARTAGGDGARQAAAMAAMVVTAKLALMVAEALVMQLLGFEVFQIERWEVATYGVGLHQPLVISMVAGFAVVNLTSSRRAFLRVLDYSSQPVFIAFFTLAGALLRLDALAANLPAAALIFALRFCGILIGSYAGGRLGGCERLHYEHFWMGFITQAGVALGLLSKVSTDFRWGGVLATSVTAEVLLNQLAGPLLFKAALVATGEAHSRYAPASPAPLGVSPPSRPQPRNAVLVSLASDVEAEAVRLRLQRRGWEVAHCDASFGFGLTPPSQLAAATLASRQRLAQLRRTAHEPRLRRLLGSGAADGKGGAVRPCAVPLCGGGGGGASGAGEGVGVGAGGGARDDDLSELALLWAVSSLPSLDVLLLLLPDDTHNLQLCRMLARSAELLPAIHQRQTAAPQLVVRVSDAAFEARYRAEADALAPLVMTLATRDAALPNLLAEMLHPASHWELDLDNELPPPPSMPSRPAWLTGDVSRI